MKLTFDPLYNEDGSPCYFRASCLAVFAICLILHVFLKPSDKNSSVSEEGQTILNGSIAYNANNSVQPQQVIANSDGQVVSNLTENSSWSLFSSDDDKELATLVKNRKAALAEMADGASFLTACGNINSGYVGCKFDFSSKVSKHYLSKVEAVDDGFTIILEAKGEQLKDSCARFEANSEGVYQAYDRNGQLNQNCLINSALSKQVLAITGGNNTVNINNTVLAETYK